MCIGGLFGGTLDEERRPCDAESKRNRLSFLTRPNFLYDIRFDPCRASLRLRRLSVRLKRTSRR